ncbi:MAG: hypothetical protein PVF58_19005 [Candidatus Methanofastidiosia archaeon]|jgi:hypothetical protein
MSTVTVRGSTKVGIASIVNTIFGDASPVLDDSATRDSRDTIQNIGTGELIKTRYCW